MFVFYFFIFPNLQQKKKFHFKILGLRFLNKIQIFIGQKQTNKVHYKLKYLNKNI
jgi:hypothetical protein